MKNKKYWCGEADEFIGHKMILENNARAIVFNQKFIDINAKLKRFKQIYRSLWWEKRSRNSMRFSQILL